MSAIKRVSVTQGCPLGSTVLELLKGAELVGEVIGNS